MFKKLLIAIVILLSCFFAAVAILQSAAFKEYALNNINEYISKSTNDSLKIDEIQIDFPFTVILKNVSYENYHINKLQASLSLRRLIYGKIKFKRLIIEDVEIGDKQKSDVKRCFEIPEMPDYFSHFKLNDLQIRRLKFKNQFIDITGAVSNDIDSSTLNLNLDITSPEWNKITTQIILKRHLNSLKAQILLVQNAMVVKTEAYLNPDFTLALKDISATYSSIFKLQGDKIHVNFDPFYLKGSLKGNFNDIVIKDVNLKGKAFFHAILSEDFLNIKVKSKELKAFDMTCSNVFAKISIQNPYTNPATNLKIKTEKVVKKDGETDYLFSKLSLNTDLDLVANVANFTLTCAEEPNLHASIEASGKCDYNKDNLKIHFKKLSGHLFNEKISLSKPFSLYLQPNGFELTRVFASFGDATVQLKANVKNQIGETELQIQNFPAQAITDKIENGHLDADIKLTGPLANPTGKVLLKLKKVTLGGHDLQKVPSLHADLSINIDQSIWNVDGSIKEEKQNPVLLKAKLPVTLSLYPYSLKLDKDRPLQATFSLSGHLAPLVELLKTSASNLSGKTTINIDVSGSINNLVVNGAAEIIEGTFEMPETGALYKNINAHLIVNKSQVQVTDLTGTDAFNGVIRGKGNIDINIEKEFPFDFDIAIENTKLLRLDYATATGNGHLKLTGNLSGATLEGKVLAEEAKVRIPEDSPILVQTVDVTYINRDESNTQDDYTKDTVWPIKLNLEFDVKEPFSINGTDLKSRWAGSLKIKGTAETPELFGEFRVVDGQYKFNGKVFDINEGSISFAGDPGKKTSLYVIASQDLGDIKAEVILKGALKSPAISFRSNPPLPQREILSWILFGHGASELNSFQGSQLNQSITNLKRSGSSTGPDLITKIRNKIGIDTIDFKHSESDSNDVSIKVGKYVSKGILVSVNKSISADANRLEIEAKLIKNFKVQAQIGDDSEGQLNLKWKTDY
jgi:autotransporter translocation and assembly factor TamB